MGGINLIKKKEEDIRIGKKIKRIRVELNMDQKTFSEKIGSTVSALSNWENGRNKPNDIMLHSIAELGNTTVEQLSQSGIVCSVCKNENVLPEHNYCAICGTKIKKEPTSLADEVSH